MLTEGGNPRAGIDVFNRVLSMDYRPGATMYNLGCANALVGERQAATNWLMKAAAAGFDVGGYAKGDKDLESMRDEPWLADKSVGGTKPNHWVSPSRTAANRAERSRRCRLPHETWPALFFRPRLA